MVVGDTGSGLEQQKQVAEAMARHAAKCQATNPVNFVLLVGDNFYSNSVSSTDVPQWQDNLGRCMTRPVVCAVFCRVWHRPPLSAMTK